MTKEYRTRAPTPAVQSELAGPAAVPACGHTEGPHHDCAYVDARNALLDHAEAQTNRVVGVVGLLDSRERRARWGRLFLRAMDEATR